MHPDWITLDFPVILQQLQTYAVSDRARNTLAQLEPSLREVDCRRRMRETTAARQVLDALGSPPLAMMHSLEECLSLARIGAMLTPDQLIETARFATACRRTGAYLARGESQSPEVASYRYTLTDLSALQDRIEASVAEDRVLDEASPQLRNIRRKLEFTEGRIREKLAQILQSKKTLLADSFITTRNGRFVLPVQRRFQNQFGGSVVDASNTGGTVFMEPSAIVPLQAERSALSIEEDAEVRRVLYTLSAEVAAQAEGIERNMACMETLDVLFAKAKLSAAMRAREVPVDGQRRLSIRKGRHPLLDPEAIVPLDFEMDDAAHGVIITGPNTGGKTVALKTVGLLSLMAQCGLHVPCGEGSAFAMHDGYWCDIGDAQSISQNLSTFSGHMTNVIRILHGASRDSLVLLDELGSGTDPAEGMGIAIAVLEELRQRGCMFLVTTHYPQVKAYTETAPGIIGARMAFDPETLAPLYRLEMGKTGESCALHIARRLGLPPHLLERAHRAVYGAEEPAKTAASPMPAPKSRLIRLPPERAGNDPAMKFSMGDSVAVLPEKETGIVYRPADELGDVIVQVKGVKRTVRHTRLQLLVPASELYPPDYDFSIVFDTVENRKASHLLGRRYDADAVVVHRTGLEE